MDKEQVINTLTTIVNTAQKSIATIKGEGNETEDTLREMLEGISKAANETLIDIYTREAERETWLDRIGTAWTIPHGSYDEFGAPNICLGKLLGYGKCIMPYDGEHDCRDCWLTPVDEIEVRTE